MIQLNGWVIIRESYSEVGENERKLNQVVTKIEAKISELDVVNEFYGLRNLNGEYHLSIMVNHNHRSDHVIEFFKWIASISVGSFGILYVQDDEDLERGNENVFKVWRMKKGKVDELDDPFLSPVNPEVEE